MRLSRIIFGLVLLVAAGAYQPANAQLASMTLEQAVQMALQTHPQVLAQFEVIEAAKHARQEAMRFWFPKVDVWLAYGQEYSDSPSLRAAGTPDVILWRREASVTAQQILFKGLDTYHHVKQMGAAMVAEQHRLGDISEVLALRAINAYLDVAQQRGQVKLAEAYVARTNKRMREIKERLNRGVGRSSDVDQVRQRLAQAQTLLLNRKRDLEAADAVFKEVMGVNPPARLAPVTLPAKMPATVKAVIDKALKSHPALLRRQSELQSDREAAKRTLGRYFPTVSLVGQVSRNRNIDGVEGDNSDASIMAVMAWNVFNGLGDMAERNRNLAVVREKIKGIEALRRIIIRNAVVSWNAMTAAKNDLPQLQEAVVSSKAVVEAFEAQFGLGQRTLLDLLNVESSNYDSQAAALQGRYTLLSESFGVLASYANVLESLGLKRAKPHAAIKVVPAKAPATAAKPMPAPPLARTAKPATAPAQQAAAAPPASTAVKKWPGQ